MTKQFKVELMDYEDLTEEQKEEVPNNGCGKDMANYIAITDDTETRVYSDSMEPEDATFYRDLSWIESELHAAYEQGRDDEFLHGDEE